MAEGSSELGTSVKDSDCLYDFPCSPCERNLRNNVEAIKYCTDCDDNLCPKCLTSHDELSATRLHTVLDQVQTCTTNWKQLPSQRCSKHGGKIIDVFCPKHDAVGCPSCISADHSSCKGKKLVPDVAADIKTSKELKQIETEMKTLESKLDVLKKMKSDNLQRLKQDKSALKKQIHIVRKKMNEQLDRMEKELEDEVDTKFKEKIDAIHASISEVDDMLARVKHGLNQVKSDNNDADLFVSCKIMKQDMSNEIHPMYTKVEERPPGRSFELYIDENSKLIMEGKRMIASIKEKYTVQGAEFMEDINIHFSNDKFKCTVYAICALPDGCLVMGDYSNKKLKKLDPVTNNVSTLIKLPAQPVGVCLVDNTRLAVSLVNLNKIQFVSLSGQFTLDNSFSVGDTCRGLAYCGGLLYVGCGGSPNPEDKQGRGHVEVYNCNGELLRCLYEEFRTPNYLSVFDDGYNTTMYVSNLYKGIQVRGVDGTVKHRFPTVLDTLLPFCLIGTDQVCIGEYSTRNIYIQTNQNKRILIEKKDVKGKPTCVYFDDLSSRLFVTRDDCDTIKVFKLKM